MITLILVIIYVSFISLGLPDSLLGVSWPIMQKDLDAALGAAGIISMVISGGTIVSSFLSGKILKRFGTGKVTAVSVLLTAVALLGISFAPSFLWMIVLAIPLGLGAGAVDAGLNAYVANHFKSYHMSWLHCFWGLGAMTGPFIMSQFIRNKNSWRNGYLTVAMLQFVLCIILFLTLPIWGRLEKLHGAVETDTDSKDNHQKKEHKELTNRQLFALKGVKPVMITFLLYCAAESTLGLWGSSYLVRVKNIDTSVAAQWVAMYYGGITLGRFINGFLTMKLSNKTLIRMGMMILFIGSVLFILPFSDYLSLVGLILAGLGCAPIYPCTIHETPVRFGKDNAQLLMGIQMAVAYVGSTFLPPLFGLAASITTVALYPYVIMTYAVFMLLCSERANLVFRSVMKYRA